MALGVAFGTLAIPLAVDGRWTGSAWALEGAGLLWIGIRQDRRLARTAGFLLQFAAGFSFLAAAPAPAGSVPVLNGVYVGAVLVSLAGLWSAFYFDRHKAAGEAVEPASASIVLLWWGLLWWFGAGFNEIETHIRSVDELSAALVFTAASSVAMAALRTRLAWRHLSLPLVLFLPVMAFVAVAAIVTVSHPFVRWGAVAWVVALAAHYWIQWRLESEWPGRVAGYWHRGMLWLVVFLASREVAWLVEQAAGNASAWRDVGWIVIPVATIAALPALTRRSGWPFDRFAEAYLGALVPVAAVVAFWAFVMSFARGNSAPLPYVPLVNPLELAQCLALVVLVRWAGLARISEGARWSLWSVLAFVVLNGIIARAVHFYGGVDFDMDALWASELYQTAVSIVWTAAALVAMLSAKWLKERTTWFVGAALLGTVVMKLFVVDLDDAGTVARIVSFVVVGLLILIIGYLSPLPPREAQS